LTPCAALPRASRPRQSCRRPMPARDALGSRPRRSARILASRQSHPRSMSAAADSADRRPPALTLDPHPEVRDTPPQGEFGRSEFYPRSCTGSSRPRSVR
jgi:hypothetical protein